MVPIRKILVPVDFSDTARRAMRVAADLAKRFGATMTVLHVYQTPGYVFPDGMTIAGPEVMAEVARRIEETTNQWREEASHLEEGVPVDAQTAMGSAPSEIVRLAAEGGYDLIVIGTHGRTGIRHAILGSVAERVVRTAPCLVLTVKAVHEEEAARP